MNLQTTRKEKGIPQLIVESDFYRPGRKFTVKEVSERFCKKPESVRSACETLKSQGGLLRSRETSITTYERPKGVH
ncbi:MAG: hypothetical protein AAF662_10115, partial [Pseudomonadota bacterium]